MNKKINIGDLIYVYNREYTVYKIQLGESDDFTEGFFPTTGRLHLIDGNDGICVDGYDPELIEYIKNNTI